MRTKHKSRELRIKQRNRWARLKAGRDKKGAVILELEDSGRYGGHARMKLETADTGLLRDWLSEQLEIIRAAHDEFYNARPVNPIKQDGIQPPVIPAGVGELINDWKSHGDGIGKAFYRIGQLPAAIISETEQWVLDHQSDFAQAWLFNDWIIEGDTVNVRIDVTAHGLE